MHRKAPVSRDFKLIWPSQWSFRTPPHRNHAEPTPQLNILFDYRNQPPEHFLFKAVLHERVFVLINWDQVCSISSIINIPAVSLSSLDKASSPFFWVIPYSLNMQLCSGGGIWSHNIGSTLIYHNSHQVNMTCILIKFQHHFSPNVKRPSLLASCLSDDDHRLFLFNQRSGSSVFLRNC